MLLPNFPTSFDRATANLEIFSIGVSDDKEQEKYYMIVFRDQSWLSLKLENFCAEGDISAFLKYEISLLQASDGIKLRILFSAHYLNYDTSLGALDAIRKVLDRYNLKWRYLVRD